MFPHQKHRKLGPAVVLHHHGARFIVLQSGLLVIGELGPQQGEHALSRGGRWLHQGDEFHALEPVGEVVALGKPEGQDGGVLGGGDTVALVRQEAALKVSEALGQWGNDPL